MCMAFGYHTAFEVSVSGQVLVFLQAVVKWSLSVEFAIPVSGVAPKRCTLCEMLYLPHLRSRVRKALIKTGWRGWDIAGKQ